jgi:LPS O-antigen subunit length determinant protein (WzzB/FepE family)
MKGVGKLFCFTGKFSLKASSSPELNEIRWIPPAGSSKTCTSEADRWNKMVDDHEQLHVKDAQDIARRANERLEKDVKEVNVCTERAPLTSGLQKQLEKDVKEQLEAEVQQVSDKLNEEFEKKQAERDAPGPNYPAPPPKCSACAK